MARRRKAREAALQLLFQRDLNPDVSQHSARDMLDDLLEDESLREFAWQLYVGTFASRESLDQRIQAVAENWSLSRMAPTDRNVLRMGLFEMETIGTPSAVVLNECIELARSYGSQQSSSFVNGILDKLVPSTAENEQDSVPESDGTEPGDSSVAGEPESD